MSDLFGDDFNCGTSPTPVFLPVSSISPAKVNDEIYAPINTDSDELQKLARAIKRFGLLEPIHVTRDSVVISGHRRLKACQILGLKTVPVIIHTSVESGSEEHVRLLVEANSQRVKTADMMVREAATLADPETAHREFIKKREELRQERDESASEIEDVDWGSRSRGRGRVSAAKMLMLKAARKVIDANSMYWPISVRQVHYRLLNDPPLKHASKPGSTYRNDQASYKDLCRVLAAGRVDGLIPWESITDETRPEYGGNVWDHAGPFITFELRHLFNGYQRDLLQDQEDMVVVLAEKLTVAGILKPVCRRYCVPLLIGRGYADIGTRHELAARFMRSGKKRLLLLFVNDHDPEGCNIPETVCQSLNEDFGIDWRKIVAKRAAITMDQVDLFELASETSAKATSSRHDGYVEAAGTTDIWELESLDPSDLADIVDEAIYSCIDTGKFKRQVEAEKMDHHQLTAMGKAAKQFFQKWWH